MVCAGTVSSDNPRIVVFKLDGLVDRAELAALIQSPCDGQADEVAHVGAVERGCFLEVTVQDLGLEHFVLSHEGLLPDEGELPILVAVGAL